MLNVMNLQKSAWGVVKWSTGVNNLNAINQVRVGDYVFNGEESTVAKVKQAATEIAHAGAKWMTLTGIFSPRLTNLGILNPSTPGTFRHCSEFLIEQVNTCLPSFSHLITDVNGMKTYATIGAGAIALLWGVKKLGEIGESIDNMVSVNSGGITLSTGNMKAFIIDSLDLTTVAIFAWNGYSNWESIGFLGALSVAYGLRKLTSVNPNSYKSIALQTTIISLPLIKSLPFIIKMMTNAYYS